MKTVTVKAWRRTAAHLAWGVLLASTLPGAVPLVLGQQAAAPQNVSPSSATSSAPVAAKRPEEAELPDSPGVLLSKDGGPLQRSTGAGQIALAMAPQSAQSEPAQNQTPPAQPNPSQAEQNQAEQNQAPPAPQKPVGTAAAEAPEASGVAASEPAGVAIAPAKQRRVRTLVIKVGAIIAAGVAVGTVVALTEATPSKPPGAH